MNRFSIDILLSCLQSDFQSEHIRLIHQYSTHTNAKFQCKSTTEIFHNYWEIKVCQPKYRWLSASVERGRLCQTSSFSCVGCSWLVQSTHCVQYNCVHDSWCHRHQWMQWDNAVTIWILSVSWTRKTFVLHWRKYFYHWIVKNWVSFVWCASLGVILSELMYGEDWGQEEYWGRG